MQENGETEVEEEIGITENGRERDGEGGIFL
jgi:hypothetical protein